MDIDTPNTSVSVLVTSASLPKIEETEDDKSIKERLLESLDVLEMRVEKMRRDAMQMEEDRDQLLTTCDSLKNYGLETFLDDNDVNEINRYIERIVNRCQTLEVRVHTQRDRTQEDALHQVNLLIDSLIVSLKEDPDQAKSRCVAFMNACSSSVVDGVTDKRFECTLLGCTIDDQKRVKKRLQGLLSYFDKLKVTSVQ